MGTVNAGVSIDEASVVAKNFIQSKNNHLINSFYIDNKNLIHELIETKFKSNHSDYGGCEGNNDLGIAINYSTFSTNYADMFLSPSTLKPAFKTLFDNGHLPIGPQAPFGMPSSVRQIYNTNHNMQIIPSAKGFENGWQLSNCVGDHHNIQVNSLPIMDMIKPKKTDLIIPCHISSMNIKSPSFEK